MHSRAASPEAPFGAAEHTTLEEAFKGSSKVRNNNWGSPIIVKANKILWPAQMWNAGQATNNVNMAAAKHQKHAPVKTTHTQSLDKDLREAVGVDKNWNGHNGSDRKAPNALFSKHTPACILAVYRNNAFIHTYCVFLPQWGLLFVLLCMA